MFFLALTNNGDPKKAKNDKRGTNSGEVKENQTENPAFTTQDSKGSTFETWRRRNGFGGVRILKTRHTLGLVHRRLSWFGVVAKTRSSQRKTRMLQRSKLGEGEEMASVKSEN